MSRDDPMMRIRLPDDLKAMVKARAEANHRSMNAEIVARLEWSIQAEGQQSGGGSGWIAKAKENSMAAFEKRLAALEMEFAKFRKSVADKQ